MDSFALSDYVIGGFVSSYFVELRIKFLVQGDEVAFEKSYFPVIIGL